MHLTITSPKAFSKLSDPTNHSQSHNLSYAPSFTIGRLPRVLGANTASSLAKSCGLDSVCGKRAAISSSQLCILLPVIVGEILGLRSIPCWLAASLDSNSGNGVAGIERQILDAYHRPTLIASLPEAGQYVSGWSDDVIRSAADPNCAIVH